MNKLKKCLIAKIVALSLILGIYGCGNIKCSGADNHWKAALNDSPDINTANKDCSITNAYWEVVE